MLQTDSPRPFGLDDLALPEELARQYPHLLNPTSLRHMMRRRDQNGLGVCCVRIGKKIAISRTRFEEWLASRAEAAA